MQTPSQPIGGENLRPQAKTLDVVVSQLPDEELLYDLKTHRAYCLNKTAAAVWNHCDGETTVTAMTHVIARELGTEVSEEWIWLALRQLHRSSLLEPGIVWPETMSRRAVMRKLGAGALAIPMVLAIVAPAAAQAASCVATGSRGNCTATGGNNCCSTCCNNTTDICLQTGLTNAAPCERDCQCTNSTQMRCPVATPRVCV